MTVVSVAKQDGLNLIFYTQTPKTGFLMMSQAPRL